ncbi:hypothetical protein [Achromobacter sp. DH1f]|uniref:hypothetical protein n=1 Tax=Achromobacter sp. DH1f TaxID=1397275 RepID=UPI00046AEB22|nr:hypothetical protein [Achromobacter sp. DH1f]
MSASEANQQTSARTAPATSPAGVTSLAAAREAYQAYGRAFCMATRTAPEEVDWKDEAISLVGLWMKVLQDLQLSDSGWALMTAYLRLDTIRCLGATQRLLSADVVNRMDQRAKECFDHQGQRIASDESPGSIVIEGSMDVGRMSSLRTRGASIH